MTAANTTPADATRFTIREVAARLDAGARAERCRDATFGRVFTEHMVTLRWDPDAAWHGGRVEPMAPLPLDPATVGLHYGQIVFEGLKAYRLDDGCVGVFRPDRYGERFRRSADRLMMPRLPVRDFLHAIEHLIRVDADWVPPDRDRSLYLRPLLLAADADLALRPARRYLFVLTAFVTEMFFGAKRAIDVWLSEDYVRSVPGGVGAAKYAGNYAAGYRAQAQAAEHGCDQVVWLDALERRWVEELGGMNLLFVEGEGTAARLVTPPLTGTILPGVTRESVLELAPRLGLTVAERPVSVDEWQDGCRSGRITEVFACGTAAQITSVGQVRGRDRTWQVGDGRPGPVATRLGALLADIHRGAEQAPGKWLHRIDDVRDRA
ncbi:branched-chain amino acid aminotransferase [Amycolatopsis tolypomycina]|uniref:branched-chain-amino-acid transaminase n=1 Tax=Amycolatopsis tolypomycina TaxID=208445 RepID=A0A1H4VWC9_9PSEU|nr:branched-chain amino acid aminotransferase [Amycolatopsis tolypomycina]SEC85255.1 branched-chain amino acid aminotransferase [Amycolatopsis tolypomycina]